MELNTLLVLALVVALRKNIIDLALEVVDTAEKLVHRAIDLVKNLINKIIK